MFGCVECGSPFAPGGSLLSAVQALFTQPLKWRLLGQGGIICVLLFRKRTSFKEKSDPSPHEGLMGMLTPTFLSQPVVGSR